MDIGINRAGFALTAVNAVCVRGRQSYSINSSARASSLGGTRAERLSCPVRSSARQLRPRPLAVTVLPMSVLREAVRAQRCYNSIPLQL